MYIYIYIYICILFWLHWVFISAHGFFIVACKLSLVVGSRLFLLPNMDSRACGLSSCSSWALWLWHIGFYPKACGILVCRTGINPMCTTLGGRFLTSGP